ncbi:MAG: hypothetical protein LCH51_11830, partial [Bacteroidetes bacterium]|nr:hypothetical protein [Bacteroidota bacterium]
NKDSALSTKVGINCRIGHQMASKANLDRQSVLTTDTVYEIHPFAVVGCWSVFTAFLICMNERNGFLFAVNERSDFVCCERAQWFCCCKRLQCFIGVNKSMHRFFLKSYNRSVL